MTDQEIFQRILCVVEARFDNLPPIDTISIDDHFEEDLSMESLDMIDLIMGVETAFDIKLDMTNAKNTKTFLDLVEAIKNVKPSLCQS